AVRRRLFLVGARGRPTPDAVRHASGNNGQQCARRPRGQPVYRPWQARQEQRRAGGEGAPVNRGARLPGRDSEGGARDAWAQGGGPDEVLSSLWVPATGSPRRERRGAPLAGTSGERWPLHRSFPRKRESIVAARGD